MTDICSRGSSIKDPSLLKILILTLLLLRKDQRFHASASTSESDVTALNLISGGWPTNNLGWSGNDPCGSRWTGIICDKLTDTNVKQLSLSTAGLSGKLLPSISDLVNLDTLDLSFNPNLTGPIPQTIGRMISLKILNLQGCSFTGSIPSSLGNLKLLQFLALNGNQLSESIPDSLGGLQAVYWLDLSDNLLSGSLPVSSASPNHIGLDNATGALHFHLNNNSFHGSIPKEIFSLPKLIHLLLDDNELSGFIPEEISNLSTLQILRLDKNQLEGQIPSSINELSSLMELHLSSNNLNGSLPDLSGLQQLMLLRVSENIFAPEEVPTWISTLKNLQTLEMDNDNLIGELLPSIFSLPSLEKLSLQSNHINGSLQFNVVSSSLATVSLENNSITDVGAFSNNEFQLSLAGNPVCSDSRYHFSEAVCSANSSDSSQSWSVPQTSCTNTCTNGETLNPETCTCAFPLVLQFVFNAPAFGVINYTKISSLQTQLETYFDLTTQQVVVQRADFTQSHKLLADVLIFPLTANYLSREQAGNIIQQLSSQNVNLNGFGPYLLTPLSPLPPESSTSSSISSGAIAGICIGAVVASFVLAAIGIYAFRQKRRADKAEAISKPFASWGAGTKDSGSAPNLKGARWFPYSELRKATNNFSDNNQIGAGGYGKVYKGLLPTGEVVAIKRADEDSLQGATEFKNEIELLSRVHHRNLVGLIGFCYEQGEQMLVYEYMSNGTLREHLFSKGHSKDFHWRKRLEIALGSARGLSYLHELANPPIIHRDVKSANILLDDKLMAKVADFGLSKLVDDAKAHVSTQVKGTMGYLDPEYYMTQQLTEKSDVYSFGVVLLELVTARQPIEKGKYIVREVRTALDRGGFPALQNLLDPSLRFYPNRDMESFINIALCCVEEIASKRPAMSEVAKELEVLLANVSSSAFPTGNEQDSSNPDENKSNNSFERNDPSFQYSGGFSVPTIIEPK